MKLYQFDGVDQALDLVPLAARRALDATGLSPSLDDWRALTVEQRADIAEAGSSHLVDTVRVERALAFAAAPHSAPLPEPDAERVPEELLRALGADRPITPALWHALDSLDRYTLVKVAGRKSPERLAAAYAEIIGHSALSTHLGPAGGARMVDVARKEPSLRHAVAETSVKMTPTAFERLKTASAPKGDVLAVARLAGIMAAKRTAELIPLCHPLALTKVDVAFELDAEQHAVRVQGTVEAFDRTGVEMEALAAVSIAALTVYDMLKGIDRAMEIGPTRLLAKSGGRSGDFTR